MAPMSAADAVRLRAELAKELAELSRVRDEILSRRSQRDDTTTYALALLLMNYFSTSPRSTPRMPPSAQT